ncbi:hypothetical protein IV02_30855 [Pseudomonas syringae]|uniref:Uncharacterized protein n=1 Tax=Pseudomonas syringae TaxID=317 RepID=A0A085UKZ4_PSESX|nr:hypothetical protein IV02_30855 [Pseudomonas syringae]
MAAHGRLSADVTGCFGSILLKKSVSQTARIRIDENVFFVRCCVESESANTSAPFLDFDLRRGFFCGKNQARLFQQNRSKGAGGGDNTDRPPERQLVKFIGNDFATCSAHDGQII